MRNGLWWTGVVVMATASLAAAQPGDEEREHARPRLVSESLALVAGKTNSIAVTFELDPHWHLYWKGQNDTGFAPKLDITTAPAMSVGEVQWPAPRRNVLPGSMLDHIYEGRLTLIVPVEVPKEATGSAAISVHCEWMVCMEACMPGSTDLTLSVPIGGPDAGKPGPDAALFPAAREPAPKPLPKENQAVSIDFRDGVFVIKSSTNKNLAFYPAEDSVKLTDAIADAVTDKGVLNLHLAEFPMTARLKGILDLSPPTPSKAGEPKGQPPVKPTIFWVDIPIAAPAGGPPAAAPDSKSTLKAPPSGS